MKLNERQVYVVRGSEDGNLGVYSNVKAAFQKARSYLEQNGEKSNASYSSALKEMQRLGFYEASIKGSIKGASASIECFNLNQ